MKALLIATLIALCLPAASRAKTYMLPDDEPVALIALPDAWAADDLDDGIEAVSPDEAVYVAVEAADRYDPDGALAAARAFFDDKGIVVDRASTTPKDIEINGYAGFSLTFEGRDEDGPTHVVVSVLQVSEAGALMITYWASDDGENANPDALSALLSSIQTAKKTIDQ